MITRELVEKINALWHKQNTVGLTDEEKEEQRLARQQYIDGIKSQVRNMLETIKNPENEKEVSHSHNCSCKNLKQ